MKRQQLLHDFLSLFLAICRVHALQFLTAGCQWEIMVMGVGCMVKGQVQIQQDDAQHPERGGQTVS